MAKSKTIILVLVAVVVVSLGFNVYQYSSNQALSQQNTDSAPRQEMVSQLMHTQNNINTELANLDAALLSACQKLSTMGLNGAQARIILSDLADSNSLIVNAATADEKDVLVTVEPSSYSSIEGEDIAAQEQNVQMHKTMRSAMSNMIPLVEGFPGVVMVAPIFDANDKFMGSLSIVVLPSSLINQSILGTHYSMWAMQSNGTLIYDPDPAQQGKNLLTDAIYADYPEVQAFTREVAEQQSGYGTYQYYDKNIADASKQLVSKEAYWVTVGIYGTEWRLVV
ncbi:MAG: cache domain-containing protein [Candidatus Bathyarchaeota archaeon]|nr:cache domain-containing protein [Candidatus Bathyarchaeota archaeon]